MYLGIFIALIILFIVAVLWMPIELCIDTKTNSYYIRLKGLLTASVEEDADEIVRIQLKVILFRFYFYPLRRIGEKKEPEKARERKGRRRAPPMRMMLRLLRSFQVKRFHIAIDTGDSVLNAKLYPVYAFLNFTNMDLEINFEGRNELALEVSNRPIRIIKSLVTY